MKPTSLQQVVARLVLRERGRGRVRRSGSCPRSGLQQRGDQQQQRRLARAAGPCRATISPGAMREAHAVDGAHLLARAAVVLDHLLELQHGSQRPSPGALRQGRSRARLPPGWTAQRAPPGRARGRRLPRSSPSPSDSARSAPESPVVSPVLVSTAMPSSASERSSKRIPSRSSRSTPLAGSSITSSARLRGERAGDRHAHGLGAVELVPASRAAHCSAPARSKRRAGARSRPLDGGTPAREQADHQLVEHEPAPRWGETPAGSSRSRRPARCSAVRPGRARRSARRPCPGARCRPRCAAASSARSAACPRPPPVRRRRAPARRRAARRARPAHGRSAC